MNDTRHHWPTSVYYNYYTLSGVALALLCALLIAGLFTVNLFADTPIAYLGVSYVLLAVTGAVGIAGAALGIAIGARRWRLGIRPAPPLLFRLNLSLPRHRLVALGILAGTMGIMIAGVGGSYKGITYLESDEFCGGACHTVMGPQAIAHENSPHAKVECVDCHVGGGAGAFAEAKLAGSRRLWAALTDSYSRPITGVGHQLRPVREMCENCHESSRWIGFKERTFNYFSAVEDNAPRSLRMLVKVGGTKPGSTRGQGIHYHMSSERKLEFAAEDESLDDIAWVQVTEPDGEVRTYRKRSLDDETLAQLERYEMDCIDCHSRPAHQFNSATDIMNELLGDGRLTPKLPYIKKVGTQLLEAEYETQGEGIEAIAAGLTDFYRAEYPDTLQDSQEWIAGAVDELQTEYRKNFFPEMGVRWDVYRQRIGHRDSNGCFRCHNDTLATPDGRTIFSTCTRCHVILTQSDDAALLALEADEGQAFYHLGEDGEVDREEYSECADCHTGGSEIY